jgi:cell division protein FtsB
MAYRDLHQQRNKTDKKERKIVNRLLGLKILGFMLTTFLLAAVPAQADDMDEKIKALKDEVVRLENAQAQMRAEQMEMKREATAAVTALPTFSYRPGNGLMIEAADKSWGFRTTIEANFRLEFEAGLSEAGRETGSVFGRRFRPWFIYCVDNCLYEVRAALDLDGFGTGNGKNATNTATGSILQRGDVLIHFEKLNSWLPVFYFGMDSEAAISTYRRGSSWLTPQNEYDLLSRNNGFNTGRAGNSVGVIWQDLPLDGIGIPGRIPLANLVWGNIGEGDDGLQSFREQRSVSAYLNIEPFSQMKNQWIRGLGFEMGAWFCPNDPNHTPQNPQDIACGALRIRDNGDGGRQTLFNSTQNGSGLTHYLIPGFAWAVGPYKFRAIGGFNRMDDHNDHIKGTDFLIAHDLFLWSPKGGFLSGDTNTAGSILVGTHFERTDVSCPSAATCNNGTILGRPQFSRDRILLREWNIWYFLTNRMSIGATVGWWDASNLRQATTVGTIQANTNVARNLGCVSSHQHTLNHVGAGCSWTDANITWRYQF